jgi:hypothetical protein
MGSTYTRQSSFTDGDVITADLFNNEYDQLLAAFAATTGHTHDGTSAEGGPITKLLGNSITLGAGTAGTDVTITFDGETNDGELKWMEDEDYFEFSDDILIASTEKLQFRDTAIYINSSTDGQLDLVADTEIQIAATTIDINGAVDISGNLSVGGNLDVTGTFDLSDSNFTNAGNIQLDSISGDADTNTSITFSGSDVITVATGGTTSFTVDASQNILMNAAQKVQFRDTALAINSSTDGQLDIDADTELEITAPTVDINASTAVLVSNDLKLDSDSAVLGFGADNDTTLTHTDGTGLTLNSTNKLTFGDAASFVQQSSDGVLRIDGEATVDINASTAVTVSNDLKLDSDAAVLGFGADNDVTLTHVADTGLLLNSTSVIQFNDASQKIGAPNATTLDIDATDEIELNATLVDVNANLDVSGTYTGAGLMTTGGNIVIPDAGNIGSASDTDAIAIGADGDVTLTQDLELQHDAATLSFGADNDVVLTHVADTGLLLNSTMALQFNDASQFINAPSATVLDINATDEIELNATLVDVNANLDVSGTYTGGGLMTTGGNIVIPDAGTIGSASDTDAIAIASDGVVTLTQKLIGTELDISGNIDVDGTTNLDVVDIDGAVDMASTLQLDGAITLGVAGASNGFINSPSGIFVNIDSDNNQTDRFFDIRKDSTDGSGTLLFQVLESGNVGIGVAPTTAYGNALQIHDTGTSGANLRLTDSTSGS